MPCRERSLVNNYDKVLAWVSVKFKDSSCTFPFRVINKLPVPIILGNYFSFKVILDIYPWKLVYKYGFSPDMEWNFDNLSQSKNLLITLVLPTDVDSDQILPKLGNKGDLGNFSHIIEEFPQLFSKR